MRRSGKAQVKMLRDVRHRGYQAQRTPRHPVHRMVDGRRQAPPHVSGVPQLLPLVCAAGTARKRDGQPLERGAAPLHIGTALARGAGSNASGCALVCCCCAKVCQRGKGGMDGHQHAHERLVLRYQALVDWAIPPPLAIVDLQHRAEQRLKTQLPQLPASPRRSARGGVRRLLQRERVRPAGGRGAHRHVCPSRNRSASSPSSRRWAISTSTSCGRSSSEGPSELPASVAAARRRERMAGRLMTRKWRLAEAWDAWRSTGAPQKKRRAPPARPPPWRRFPPGFPPTLAHCHSKGYS